MDTLRRGWIGLALFFAALLLMPVLVFGYDKDRSEPHPVATTSLTTTDPLDSPSPPRPTGTPLVFTGIRPGERISGFRTIQVESASYDGPLEYVLNGPIAPFRRDLSQPPYVFNPHAGGWQTTEVPNGEYTLTAIPTEVANDQISITFTVSNEAGVAG
ncbi:hypothetical protein [Frankia sp. QA3]|uniref:hypothetical protein n=1 Tax=Frankia sp. QA3 TaxID=710111 RepID=UPI000269C6D8|nr:hypothetical protein [Frankia sp. QA3]EIV93588.1 hypothetical protein FraQA3DRAFT_3297 [Frankia sp. QA3]